MSTVSADLKLITFDAAGTLIELTESVGWHYAHVGRRLGLQLDAAALEAAFGRVWKEMPARPATGEPREDDDKEWWRVLVDRIFDQVAPATRDLDRDNFFEIAYEHFAEAGVWRLFPETLEVLEALHRRYDLVVISNFDGRLRMVFEHLGISRFFKALAISSEIGADKPDPLIFQRALALGGGAQPNEALHVGDDPRRDWAAARAAGLQVFELERPRNTLRELVAACAGK